MLKQLRKQLVLAAHCLQVGKWMGKKCVPVIYTGNGLRNACGSEEASRDVVFTSSCPCITLCLCLVFQTFQDCDYSGPLIQILVSKEDEGSLNVRQTLEELSLKNAAM